MIRTYHYGALPPTSNAEIVEQQLQRAHRYQNARVEIERARRAKIPYPWPNDKEDPEVLDAADCAAAAAKAVRDELALYWGTYGLADDATRRAAQAAMRETAALRHWEAKKKAAGQNVPTSEEVMPHFKRWDGSGRIAVSYQYGLSLEELLAGKDTRAKLEGAGRRRVLHLRVSTDGRAPVWATFPVVYHRELPPNASIRQIIVRRRRVATHMRYEINFALKAPDSVFALPSPTREGIAIDVGWRRLPEGLAIAAWAQADGTCGHVVLPQRILDRWRKVQDLISIRDKAYNDILTLFLAEKREHGPEWPAWLQDRVKTMHLWKRANARLASVVVAWRTQRFPGDELLFERLEGWRKQDKHLYEWQANQDQNVLASRREIYRVFARFVAEHRTVVVEDLDLRAFAELPEEGKEEGYAAKKARPRRFRACLSELFACMADAVLRAGGDWQELPAQNTTRTCAGCGSVETFDAASERAHTCEKCGDYWDQDQNAARNLWALAKSGTVEVQRKRLKVPVDKSKVQARRAEGRKRKQERLAAKAAAAKEG